MRIAKYVLFYYPSIEDKVRWNELNIKGFWNSPNDVDYYGDNIGISGAMCRMREYSKRNNFDGFVFFDQDTLVTQETLKWMDNNIGLYGNGKIIHFSGLYKTSENIRFFINSCTYFPIAFLDAIDEKELKTYFVDGVDLFLSIKAKELGFDKIRLFMPSIDHVSNQDWLDINGPRIKAYSIERLMEIEKAHLKVLKYAVRRLLLIDVLVLFKFIFSMKVDTWKRRLLWLR